MGCLLTLFYYAIICAIGVYAIFNSMFGDGSEYVDRLAGPGFVAISGLFVIAIAPVLAIITNLIVAKIYTEAFIKQSQPIPLDPSEESLPLEPTEEKNHEESNSLISVRILAFCTDATIICTPVSILNRINASFQINYIFAISLYSLVSILAFKNTLGKKLFALEITRSNPVNDLTFKNAILRNFYVLILAPEFILRILGVKFQINQELQILSSLQMPAILFLFFADVAIFVQNKGNIALHDRISDTSCRRI